MKAPIESPYVTAAEAAAYLRCHPNTIQRLCREGKLVRGRIGRCWLIRRDSLDSALGLAEERTPQQPSYLRAVE